MRFNYNDGEIYTFFILGRELSIYMHHHENRQVQGPSNSKFGTKNKNFILLIQEFE